MCGDAGVERVHDEQGEFATAQWKASCSWTNIDHCYGWWDDSVDVLS